jgi:hypothetical protein
LIYLVGADGYQKITIIVKKVGMGVDSKVFSMTAKLGFTHN